MAITLNSFRAERSRSDGTVDNTGTCLKLSLNYTSNKSTATYVFRIQEVDTSTITQLARGNSTNYNDSYVSPVQSLNTEKAYWVSIELSDSDGIRTETAFIPKTFVLLDFNVSGKGMAVGKVSDHADALAIGLDMYDKYDTKILNGLAFYEQGGSTDADTTLEELFVSNIDEIGGMFFVRQMFLTNKTQTANRTQVAYPYAYNSSGMVGHQKSNYRRHYVNNIGWSNWMEECGIIDSGTEGIWTWKKYSDGTAECFGKINVSQVEITAALGGWYRSDYLYEATDYPFPVTFNGQPCTEMMYQTRNGSGALIWPYSTQASYAQAYLPQCYLIRPTSAASTSGNINIIVKGNL